MNFHHKLQIMVPGLRDLLITVCSGMLLQDLPCSSAVI